MDASVEGFAAGAWVAMGGRVEGVAMVASVEGVAMGAWVDVVATGAWVAMFASVAAGGWDLAGS